MELIPTLDTALLASRHEPSVSTSALSLFRSLQSAGIQLSDFIKPISELSAPKLVHALVEKQARLTPDAVALQFEQTTKLTYGELNKLSNIVARQLVCGRGSIIPICMDRSINMIVALLAVMKTGAAYVMVSPETPSTRIEFIVKDVRAPFLIVDTHNQGVIGVGQVPLVIIESLLAKTEEKSHDFHNDLIIHQAPSDIAYVIYTSGTLGNPKGVLLSHQAAVTGLEALPQFSGTKQPRQLLCHSPVFSAAQRTILGTLTRGGVLCLASKESITLKLRETVEKMQIETLEITPSMLRLMDPNQAPPSLKKITLGGEMPGPALVDLWSGKVELWTAYGLSECTQLNMRSKIVPGENRVTLGRPSDSTTCYILQPDSVLPAPANTAGELCLGGMQLGEGYLNLPEKTKQVFIDNPFGRGRLYRTGDMAILHEDGSMELLGRIDQQIKVDGQRVEPGEANAIIQVQGGVASSAVVSASILGRKSLVAVIVPNQPGTVEDWDNLVATIRATLRESLQSHAVPRYWVRLTELPINVNRKTDIAGLVRLVESMDESQLLPTPLTSGVQTGDTLDAVVRNAIADVLAISPQNISSVSTWQELGGSSLDAIILSSKLRDLGIEILVPDLLQGIALETVFADRVVTVPNLVRAPEPFSLLPHEALLPAEKQGIEDAYPVTSLQEGILADSLLGRANYVYHRVYRIQGNTTINQLRSAIQQVVQRRPMLRSTFKAWKKSFIQIVHSSLEVPWKTVANRDLEDVLQDGRNSAAMELDEPQIRATYLEPGFLIMEMHHSLFDFWSSQFVFADVNSLLRGRNPIYRAPFSAYVAYQLTNQNQSGVDGTALHWKQYLQSAPTSVLELPLAMPFTHHEAGSEQGVVLKAGLGSSLTEASQLMGVTMATVVHQAWAMTLAKHLSRSDVVFMTGFSGRDAPVEGILSLDGPTLCTVPFRASFGTDNPEKASVSSNAKDLQKNLWDLSKFAHCSLRHIFGETDLKANMVNTMVNILASLEVVGNKDSDASLLPVIVHGDNFTQYVTPSKEHDSDMQPSPLWRASLANSKAANELYRYVTLELDESNPNSIKLLVPFHAVVADCEEVLSTFVSTVKRIAESPESPLNSIFNAGSSELKILESGEIAQDEQSFGLAHAAFETCAAEEPSRVAMRTPTTSLTYGEFDSRAQDFARMLLKHGVKHGEFIPLYLEKSAETLIAIMGILKAGAAFVPLDPRNPHERNSFIIGDVGAHRIITDTTNKNECAAFGLPMIIAEDPVEHLLADPISVPGLSPDSIAYAIYTSGSTGMPKGVLVPHSAVEASARGMIEATNVTKDWTALWALNYIFDASYYDVFTLFSCGACLCIVPQEGLLADLAGHINTHGVEQVMLTPTMTKLIRGGHTDVPGLKVLNVCGEKIDTNILEWARHVDVYNGYGPTEATILMTVSKVEPDGNLNSIGHPLRHVEAVIVPAEGNSLERLPNGMTGELCVRGLQLAVGYLNRPEQTAAAFTRDLDGERLYRTGDLALRLADGSLHCLGRKDYQIKLNGFRIELGEIENAILLTGKVEASVVSVAQVNGKSQLVAFCIFAGDGRPASIGAAGGEILESRRELVGKGQELLDSLTTVAHYMVPSLVLPFSSFPSLPSGKANRKELVKLVENMEKQELASFMPAVSSSASTDFVWVSTPEEEIMQKAWSTVLDEPVDSIGSNSLFFGLGGDSIAAINVVAECRRLGYSIPVGKVLASPTLAQQASLLKRLESSGPVIKKKIEYEVPSTLWPALYQAGLSKADVEEIYPCGPGQVEFLTQGKTQHQFWNLTTSRELPSRFPLDRWREVTERMTAENQILRAMYLQADPKDDCSWYQIVLRRAALDWREVYYTTDEERKSLVTGLKDSQFQLGMPNIKYLILRSKKDEAVTLCIKVDHGSYDGTLLRIFDEQFRALARGDTVLPKIEPFRNFIDWVHTADRAGDLAFWKAELADYTPPRDAAFPRSPISDRLQFVNLAADVDAIADRFGVTPSTVFQAAYALAVGRLTRTDDVLVDNLITGRNAGVDDPQMVNGTCANFLPFRTRLGGGSAGAGSSAADFFRETQRAFWESTEHGSVGLGDIYRALGKERGTHAAKMLFCFQPFEPPAARAPAEIDHMRWLVMAQSKVMMTVNYVLMVEVQKTSAKKYRLKMQWDSHALSDESIGLVVEMFNRLFVKMEQGSDVGLESLLHG